MTKAEFKAHMIALIDEYCDDAESHEDCAFEERTDRIEDFAIYVHESQRSE